MKTTLLATVLLVCASHDAIGQAETPALHQESTAVSSGRYEIIQSSLAARWTFRLDRYAGRVSQLVSTKDSTTAWEEMPVYERPTIAAPTRARFQIFMSGMAARYTFLIDVDTGKTWVLVSEKGKDKDGAPFEYSAWQPFAK